MADKSNDKRNAYIYEWIVENFSYGWQKKGEAMKSPHFVVESMEDTKWMLSLYPRGNTNGSYVGFFLIRADDSKGPDCYELEFELSFLNADGTVLKTFGVLKKKLIKDEGWGYHTFQTREKVFSQERAKYLPGDILTVRVRMWRSDGKSIESEQLNARTIIRVMRRSFTWNIEKFSSLESGLKNTFSIRSLSKNILMLFELCVTGGQCSEEVVNISLKPSDDSIKFLTFKSFVIDSKGNKVECASHEFWSDDIKNGAKLTLLLTKKKLMESKALYLPNDVLSLRCECDFSTGIALEEINKVDFATISSQTRSEVMENEYRPIVAKPAEISLALTEDLRAMYDDGLISDMELRTKTRKFPAHKNILSARSPVFKAMFASDMLENSKGCVDIQDLEDETVHTMLVYMYTDSMKETSWKSIVQLFAAADKYDIISLKNKCFSFLKENLSEENVCEILVMADRRQDGGLKDAVENYIISHGKDIYGSAEWNRLTDTNPTLVAKTMCKHFNREQDLQEK